LRGNRLGAHFRRQQPVGAYILDFCALRAHLVVEVDGSPHSRQQGYDALRDQYLAGSGMRVLRITNDQVRHDLPSVLRAIRAALKQP